MRSWVLVGLTTGLCAGCVSPHAGDDQRLEVSCEIRRVFLADVDWSRVQDDYNGTMFDVATVSYGSHRIRLLGFEPSVRALHAYRDEVGGGYCTCAVILVGSRRNTHLYVVRRERGLLLLEVTDERGMVESGRLDPADLNLLMSRNPSAFIPFDVSTVYVEPRFYQELAERGVRLPADFNPLPHHCRKMLISESRQP